MLLHSTKSNLCLSHCFSVSLRWARTLSSSFLDFSHSKETRLLSVRSCLLSAASCSTSLARGSTSVWLTLSRSRFILWHSSTIAL